MCIRDRHTIDNDVNYAATKTREVYSRTRLAFEYVVSDNVDYDDCVFTGTTTVVDVSFDFTIPNDANLISISGNLIVRPLNDPCDSSTFHMINILIGGVDDPISQSADTTVLDSNGIKIIYKPSSSNIRTIISSPISNLNGISRVQYFVQLYEETRTTVTDSEIDVDITPRDIVMQEDGGKSILIPYSSKDREWVNTDLTEFLFTQEQKATYVVQIPGIYVGLQIGDIFRIRNDVLGVNSNVEVASIKIEYPKGITTIETGVDLKRMFDVYASQNDKIDDAVNYTGNGMVSVAYDDVSTDALALAFLQKIGYVEE